MKKRGPFSFTIAQENHAGSKNPAWLATFYRMGKRTRARFKTKGEAEAWIDERRTEAEKIGVHARGMTRAELNDAIDARARLGGGGLADAVNELLLVRDTLGTGADLRKALEEIQDARKALGGRKVGLLGAAAFYARHHPTGKALTLGELTAAYLAERERKRPSYFRNLKSKCGILLGKFGAKTRVGEIMGDDLAAFVDGLGKAPATRNGWRTFLSSLFALGAEKGAISADENPAAKLKRIDAEAADDAEFYTVEEVERLLRAAEADGPETAVGLALLLFCGIRPNELTGGYTVRNEPDAEGTGEIVGGLDWRFVRKNEVSITRRTSKTKSYRRIPIPPNCQAWIECFGGERRGRVIKNPQAWRAARERVAKAAGVRWIQDGTRHSFASYHWAHFQDRPALEHALGHTGKNNTLEKFYEAHTDAEEAARFWDIWPTKGEA